MTIAARTDSSTHRTDRPLASATDIWHQLHEHLQYFALLHTASKHTSSSYHQTTNQAHPTVSQHGQAPTLRSTPDHHCHFSIPTNTPDRPPSSTSNPSS
jgi:hypothetical protein